MEKIFRFPDVGEGIAEGEIVQWLISEGDVVTEDQAIIEVETDKAVVSLPTPYSGTIVRIQGKAGDIIPVGATLVAIETTAIEDSGKTTAPLSSPEQEAESSDSASTKDASPKEDAGSVVGVLATAQGVFKLPNLVADAAATTNKKVRAIPSVRKFAKTLDIDLSTVAGSGNEGRILRSDVEKAAEKRHTATSTAPKQEATPSRDATTSETAASSNQPSKPSALGPVEHVPFRGVRRSAARHVSESTQHVAPVTFVDDADISKLARVRNAKKGLTEEQGYKLTYLPFIIKSVIAGLKAYPYLNATLDEAADEILLKKYYNIGIAADTPGGLMVFVLKNADQKSILELAEEISATTEKANARTIALADLKGGTFTLTNYGVLGGIYGTPIINYPEVGILGIGKIEDRPVVRDGEIVIRTMLPLSLTFDHRVIFGAESARFMNTVIAHLEDPDLLLVTGK